MDFRALKEGEWQIFQKTQGCKFTIEEKAKRFAKGLSNVFNEKQQGPYGLEFTASVASDRIADISSEFGKGRLKLYFRSDENHIFGDLRLERQVFDSYDVPIWEAAFAFHIPVQGVIEIGTATGTYKFTSDRMSNRNGEDLYIAALSMLYAIVNGPELTLAE